LRRSKTIDYVNFDFANDEIAEARRQRAIKHLMSNEDDEDGRQKGLVPSLFDTDDQLLKEEFIKRMQRKENHWIYDSPTIRQKMKDFMDDEIELEEKMILEQFEK